MVRQRLGQTIILTGCLAAPLSAGPWLREEGSGFFSVTTEIAALSDIRSGLFVEYGAHPDVTLGAKADIDILQGQPRIRSALVFFRRPLGRTDGTWRYAYDLGAGLQNEARNSHALAKLGASIGRGFPMGDISGWTTLDASLEYSFGTRPTLWKLDATVGLNLSDEWKAMMQAFAAASNGKTRVTLAPSLVWSPPTTHSSVQFGFEFEDGTMSARFGLWRNF